MKNGDSCLECDYLVVSRTDIPNGIDLSRFKRPDRIVEFKSEFRCKRNNELCSSRYWYCIAFEQKDWVKAVEKDDKIIKKQEENSKLSDRNYNNLSEELINLVI